MQVLYSRKQAAERLGVSLPTLDALRADRRLAYVQRVPGGKVQITETAIEEYLARATHTARPIREVTGTYRRRRA